MFFRDFGYQAAMPFSIMFTTDITPKDITKDSIDVICVRASASVINQ